MEGGAPGPETSQGGSAQDSTPCPQVPVPSAQHRETRRGAVGAETSRRGVLPSRLVSGSPFRPRLTLTSREALLDAPVQPPSQDDRRRAGAGLWIRRGDTLDDGPGTHGAHLGSSGQAGTRVAFPVRCHLPCTASLRAARWLAGAHAASQMGSPALLVTRSPGPAGVLAARPAVQRLHLTHRESGQRTCPNLGGTHHEDRSPGGSGTAAKLQVAGVPAEGAASHSWLNNPTCQ